MGVAKVERKLLSVSTEELSDNHSIPDREFDKLTDTEGSKNWESLYY